MQEMLLLREGAIERVELPPQDSRVVPGVNWGCFDHLFTAAYWKVQAWQAQRVGRYRNLRLGRDLIEETAACLLGGYGMKAEIGLAAFERLRDRGVLRGSPQPAAIMEHLEEPFAIGGRPHRYRYPRQKSVYLSQCLGKLHEFEEPSDDAALRDALTDLPGVGLKTASWIVRNHRGSDDVAVIDVHILRAGRLLGLFSRKADPQREYKSLEGRFLRFAQAIDVPASLLDALMWDHMRLLAGCVPDAA